MEAALVDFNTIIDPGMSNSAQALNMRAVIFYTQNKYTPALDDLTAAIGRDPQYAMSYQRRAIIYIALGKRSEAVADLRKEAEKLLQSLGG